MATEQLVIEVTAEIEGLRQQMQQVNRVLQNSASQVQQAGQQAGENFVSGFNNAMKALAGAISLKAIFNFGKEIAETTGDIKALEEQYSQVVGDMKGQTDKYLDEMAQKWGKHPRELQSAFTQYFAQLKAKGIEEKEAYKLAKMYLERTADASAFINEDMAETTKRFSAMIRGEYSSIDTAYIQMSQTLLNDKSLEVYGKKWQELTAAQQENLKMQIALQQHTSGEVFGQAEREADSWQNTVGRLRETWRDFLKALGDTGVFDIISNSLKIVTEILGRWIQRLKEGDPIVVAFTAVIGVLTAILAGYAVVAGISALATGALSGALAVLTSPITLIIAGIVGIVTAIVTLWKKSETFRNWVTNAGKKIKQDFLNAVEDVKRAFSAVVGFFKNVGSAIVDAFKGAVSKVKAVFEDLFGAVKNVVGKIKNLWNTITGKKTVSADITVSGGDTQKHAKGGIFTGYSRLGNHIFGEAGHEAVIPLSHKGLRPFAEALNRYTNMGSNIYIQHMHVRNDGDIQRIAYELKRLQDAENRKRGFGYGY